MLARNHLIFQKLSPSTVVDRKVQIVGHYNEEFSVEATVKFGDAIKRS